MDSTEMAAIILPMANFIEFIQFFYIYLCNYTLDVIRLVNSSLQTGVFPNEWKLALGTPLMKKPGLDTILKNYRPVSNLCLVSKITERAVILQQKEHMEHNCSLPILSSAYREGHSTESALLKFMLIFYIIWSNR